LKTPRDIGGQELAETLYKFGFQVTRQTGSHLRLTSRYTGIEAHVTIPVHKPLAIGTLSSILGAVADYLHEDKQKLEDDLFKN
jgi:predicted RNA binding protein YcfA (HicA-like mRNA interferase family)